MNNPRVHILAFDADGCLYNSKYKKLMIEVLNRHWEFLASNGKRQDSLPGDVNAIKQKTNSIIEEIQALSQTDLDDIDIKITNPNFLNKIEAIKEKLPPGAHVNISSILLDFIRYMNRLDSELLPNIFLGANRELITHLCNKMQTLKVPNVAFVTASNRQSFYIDQANIKINGTGSIYLDLSNLKNAMQNQLKDKVCKVSPFCMADIFGANLSRGDSFRNICNDYRFNDPNQLDFSHANSIFDKRKLLLLYVIAHDAANYILKEFNIDDKKSPITIDFFDDNLSILLSLIEVLNKFPQLIPDNVTLNFYPYDGILQTTPIACITGTGDLDINFWKNAKLMVNMCTHAADDFSHSVDTISQLDIPNFLSRRVTEQENSPVKMNNHFARWFQPKQIKEEENIYETIINSGTPSYN